LISEIWHDLYLIAKQYKVDCALWHITNVLTIMAMIQIRGFYPYGLIVLERFLYDCTSSRDIL
jgi:hypothetical protein